MRAMIVGVLLLSAACAMPETPGVECDPDNGGLTLAPGFCALVVADGLGPARHLAVAPNGDVYVRFRTVGDTGGIAALRDTTGDGRADIIQRFHSETAGSGIALADGWLYFSTDTAVYRVRLPDDGSLMPTAVPEPIVAAFPVQRRHSAKPFALDGAGGLYVTVGSPTNACQPVEQDNQPGVPGLDPCTEFPLQGGVWRFDANRAGQMQGTDGEPYTLGIRNAMAIAWNPQVSALYVVQHGRDILDVIAPGVYTQEDNATKAGELLYRLSAGDTLMHPYCFWDLDQQRAVVNPEYGGDGQSADRCAQFPAPLAAYPAHWAPDGLLFYTGTLFPERYANGAFIAFHGSWNRAPLAMAGYQVVFQPMTNGEPAGEFEMFADGFAGSPEIMSVGDALYRPVGLAQGPDGSLYISSDVRGRIWRVLPVQ